MTRFAAMAAVLVAGAAPSGASAADGTIDLPRFRIVHTDRAGAAAASLSGTLEDERNALVVRLGRDWDGKVDVFVAEGAEDARALGPRPADAILVDARALRGAGGEQALRDALVRLALRRLGTWPRWFIDGLAAVHAGDWSLGNALATLRSSTRPEAAIPLESISTDWPERLAEAQLAHAQSRSFVAYLLETGDEPALRDLVGKVSAGQEFAAAFRDVYHQELAVQEARWRTESSDRWSWVSAATHPMTLWVAFTACCALAWLRLRHRQRLKQAEAELVEKAQEAAMRIAAAEQQRRPHPTPIGGDERPARPSRPSKPVLH